MLATYFVDTTLDTDSGICVADNPGGNIGCSIRSAIDAARQNSGADTIRIPDGNYVLSTSFGSLDVFDSADVSFIGNAANPAAVVIDGVNESRVFDMFGIGSVYNVSFEGMTIQNGIGRDGSGGGGINSGSDINLRLNRVVVQNNQAAISYYGSPSSGGGIQASGNVTITNSVIRNNTATQFGGGIDFDTSPDKELRITNTEISGNSAGDPQLNSGFGGALFVASATAVLNQVTVDNNSAGDSGGGIYSEDASLELNSSVVRNNRALGSDSGGGGVYVVGFGPSSPTFSVLGGSFDSNTAVSGAGGFEAVDVGGTIDGAIFSLNRVTGAGTSFDQGGGAIAILSTSPSNASLVTLSNLLVDGNTAPSAGGIAAVDAKLSIENSSILNNEATGLLIGSAGGIGAVASAAGSTLNIFNSSIAGNTAELQAGGIGAIDVNVTISSSIVESNIARTGRAGGIGLAGQAGINPVLTTNAVTISGNQSGGDGGGIGVQAARVDLLNTTLSGNRSVSGNGGGLALINATSGSIASFTTVASNQAVLGSNVAMQNTILSLEGSLFAAGTGVAVGSSFQSLGNNLDQSGTMGLGGAGDLSGVNPQLGPLQDNGGPVPTHALLPGSPAIDAGPVSGPSVDARGVARPQDGDGVGGVAFDIGAFEAAQQLASLVVDTTTDIDDGDFSPGNLSLREAIGLVNSGQASDTTITFDSSVFSVPQVIVLSGTQLDLTSSMEIVGPDQSLLTISGDNRTRIFEVSGSGTLATISGVTLRDGLAIGGPGPGNGGAVRVDAANLTIANSTITGNVSQADGGGIWSNGTLALLDSTVSNNSAYGLYTGIGYGGGILNGGSLVLTRSRITGNLASEDGGGLATFNSTIISDSEISDNSAYSFGGGIAAFGTASVSVTGSTIANNSSGTSGGGVFISEADVTLRSSTISGNLAIGDGGGLFNYYGGTLNLINSTISGNSAYGDGGGVRIDSTGPQSNLSIVQSTLVLNRSDADGDSQGTGGGLSVPLGASGTTDLFGSIVAGNLSGAVGMDAPSDIVGPSLFTSFNLIGDPATSGGLVDGVGGNIVGLSGAVIVLDTVIDPVLADNGGQTLTHALRPGSLAIDAGEPNFNPNLFIPALENDQRGSGFDRVKDGDGDTVLRIDIGAIEADFVQPRVLTIRNVVVDEAAGTATVAVQLNAAGPSFSVDFDTSGINATEGVDFVGASGSLSFVGQANEIRLFQISIDDDGLTELDESIFVSLSNLVKSSSSDPDVNILDTGIVTIVDDDVTFLVPTLVSINENTGIATYALSLSGEVDESFTVDVTTTEIPRGAVAGSDFTGASQRLTFAGLDGESQTFSVSITPDDVVEGDEAFGVLARNIQGGGRAIQFSGALSSADINSLDQFTTGGIFAQAIDLSIPRGEAYVATDTGLQVIDTSDPSQLTAVQSFSTAQPVSDVQVVGDIAYLASGNTLLVVDLGSSSNPRLIGSFTSSNSVTGVQVSGDRAYLLESDSLGGGLRVVDVFNPSNITSLGFFGSSFTDLFVDGTTVYVTDPFNGLRVLDATAPSLILELGSFPGIEPLAVDVRGSRAYVGASGGLSVIDVSNPAAMSLLGAFVTFDDVTAVRVDESQSTVTIAEFSGVLRVLDLSDLGNLRELGQFAGLDSPFALGVDPNLVFVADGAGGLRSFGVESSQLSTASILNDDFATLTVSDVTVDEASGSASVTVTLDKAVEGGFTYQFTTNDGTATQGSDYTATTGTLSSGNLGEQQTITIPILSDSVPEGIETFTVSLFNIVPFGNVSPSSINASDVGTITITEAGIVDLAISKSDSQDPVRPDSNLTYTLLVTNNGTADANGIVAVDQLPAGVTFVSGDVDGNSSQVSVLGNTVTADIGGLVASESATVTIIVRVDAAASGLLSNTATVSSIEDDANPANNTDTETTGVDRITASDDTLDINEDDLVQVINVLGNDDPGPGGPLTIFSVGTAALGNVVIAGGGTRLEYTPSEHAFGRDTFLYTVQSPTGLLASATVTVNIASVNDPPTAADDSVDANDRLSVTIPISSLLSNDNAGPANEGQSPQFVSASVTSTNGGTISVSEGNLVYTPSASFTGNVDSFTYTITDGEFTDTATVTVNLPPLPNIDLTTSITDSTDPVDAGSSLTFTVVVSNLGSDFASNVVSTVFIASDFTILSAEASPSGSVSVSGNTVTATLISLNGGGSATITITAVASDVEGSFTSSAIVSSSDVDLLPTNNSDSELTSIVVPASLIGHVYCDLDGSGDETSGEGSAGVRVFLDSDGDRIFDSGERFTFTDSAGDYRFVNITETFVTVVAEVPQGCNTIPFNPGIVRSSVGVGDLARSIFDVDIDGDGDLDLLVASDRSNSLTVLVNEGGNFTLREQIPLADRPQSVVAWREASSSAPPLIAVAGVGTPADGGSLFVFSLGGPVASIKVGNGPIDVAIDDFDLNGEPDVVVGTLRSSDVQVFMNGSTEPIPVTVARLVRSVSTGDVNGDGLPDIVVGGYGYPGDPESELLVLLGDGEGGFDEPIVAGISQQLVATKVASLTMPAEEMPEDESQDMRVMALSAAGEFKLFTLDGPELIETTMLSVSPGSNAFDLGDFNSDGLTDVAISNQGQQRIDLFVGDGTGRFIEILSLGNVSAPSDLVVADLDNDGQMDDLAVTNLYQNSRIGLPGVPGFFLPSATTIVRLDVSEAPVVIGGASTRVDFVFQSADPAIRFDVSGDGMVSALDALRVINAMARLQGEGEQIGTASRAVTDVNGDGRTSAIDALMIINLLSEHPGGQVALQDLDLLSDDDDEGDRIAAVDVLFAGKLF